ncbi:MAG: hypothetical protein JWM80_2670 [Cyanobacteria bacterium RYN_339]|nr:hypothetical protein [Cyanobacteria bacterium RYN_339]
MSFKSIAADNLSERVMGILGKGGKDLTRTELKGVSEATFRMLDDQLVMNSGVSAKELSAALQNVDDAAADKLNRSLGKSETTPWHKKIFSSPHKEGLMSTLESIFKKAPAPTP